MIVVVGAGNPLIDVPAVQSAVDQGGTVLLRGTFDFGTHAGNHIIVPGRPYPGQNEKGKSTVFVYQKDVTILGEKGTSRAYLGLESRGLDRSHRLREGCRGATGEDRTDCKPRVNNCLFGVKKGYCRGAVDGGTPLGSGRGLQGQGHPTIAKWKESEEF
jgi:hypothetical protein